MYIFLSGNETTNFGDFSKGVLLGLSIGSNLVGIILTAAYIGIEDKKTKKKINRYYKTKNYISKHL